MKNKVKFCGLSRQSDISAVNRLRPDYVGFVFAKSRRQVTQEQAEDLSGQLIKEIVPVGVFADEKQDTILKFLKKEIIRAVQLHGNEDEEYIRKLKAAINVPLIKAVPVEGEEDILKAQKFSADYLLLDRGRGGTGESFSWKALRKVLAKQRIKPFFLAGGICERNIKEAMTLDAWCLDISSGIETEGRKDEKKMSRLIGLLKEE